MLPENGPAHVQCSIIWNVRVLATEAEFGGLFENCQSQTSIHTYLAEMGHPQPPNPVATNNIEANTIVNIMARQK